jgi:hypothetical protein
MSYDITSFSRSDLKRELFDTAQIETPDSQEAWNAIVDDMVENHVDLGQLDEDQDTGGIKEYLYTLWSEFQATTDADVAVADENEEV